MSWARKTASALARVISPLFIDLTGLVGAGLIVYGTFEIYRPAALLVAGAMLVGFAAVAARKSVE
jgi:hypothetical protein